MNHLLKIECEGSILSFDASIKQTLMPALSQSFKRTIDGRLLSINLLGQTKYKSLIEGQDPILPDLVHAWGGKVLRVDCLQRLKELYTLNSDNDFITLSNNPVPSSVVVSYAKEKNEKPTYKVSGRHIFIAPSDTVDLTRYEISYRPCLEMRIVDFKWVSRAYEKEAHWCLFLEET